MRGAAAVAAGAAAAILALGVAVATRVARDAERTPPDLGAAPRAPASATGAAAHAAPGAARTATAPATAQAAEAGSPPPRPPSLAGTEPSGGLALDADGRFVPGPEAIALFEYFFAASGEEPGAVIAARIRAEIRRRLPPAAAEEAEALLARYLAYREDAASLFASDLALAEPERRFQRVRELRRAAFGAALAAALFGEEEAIVAIDLERRRVAQDPGLAPDERARRLASLDERLPPPERAARADARAVLDLRAAERSLREAGAGEAEVAAERERRFGREAAERLAALDARRAAWEARVAAYRAAREAIRAERLPPDAEAEALARLRAERFEGPERIRIEALDRLEAESAAR